MSDWRDKDWKYVNAEDTRKPGYLARKFALIQNRMKKEAEAAQQEPAKVRSIGKK